MTKIDTKIGKWFKHKSSKYVNHVIGHKKSGYIYERYSDGGLIETCDGWKHFDEWNEIPPLIDVEKQPNKIIEEDNEFRFLEI